MSMSRKITEKSELIKHSGAVQIDGNINLVQRKCWNILLANCFNDLGKKRNHTISVSDILLALGQVDSKNHTFIKTSLLSLVSTTVSWNVLGKDKKNIWVASSLLAGCEVKDGICTYDYSSFLEDVMSDPKMYTKIKLSIQNSFRSYYVMALYELAFDYLHTSKGRGETPWIALDQFKKLLGVKDGSHTEFKVFNRDVLKPAIKNIHKYTDIRVEVVTRKIGRKISELKVKVFKKPDKLREESDKIQRKKNNPELDRLISFGIARGVALKYINEYSQDYIQEKLEIVDKKVRLSKVSSPSGFLVEAIEKDYKPDTKGVEAANKEEVVNKIAVQPLEFATRELFEEEVGRLSAQGIEPVYPENDMRIAEAQWSVI